ncbi:MAG: hypothetical protein PUP92_29350 [Rhizonema sp. PD38]|nr:hypothetical protein [Rhizonema sp. PD38]
MERFSELFHLTTQARDVRSATTLTLTIETARGFYALSAGTSLTPIG